MTENRRGEARVEMHPGRGGSSASPPVRLTLLASVGLATALALALNRPPAARDASAKDTEFSAARALDELRAIARAPRPVGSAAHLVAREHIVAALRARGIEPEVQSAEVAVSAWGLPVPGGVVQNIVATLPGVERGPALLLASHYDSVPGSPGASDDGAAVAAMLETLRALRAGPPLKNDIVFLFTDAEELGCVGAQAFADRHPLARRIAVALNFDARGSSGPVYMFETSEKSGWLIRELAAAAPAIVASSLSVEVYRRMPNYTDFTIFRENGMRGMNFAYLGGLRHYHSPSDTIENLDLRSLQHEGSYMLSLARRLGSADLHETGDHDEIYFNPAGRWFVHYPATWAAPLVGISWAAVLGTVVVGVRRRRLSLSRVAAGLGVLLANVALTWIVITVAWRALRAADPRLWPGSDGELDSELYMIGFTALAVAISCGVVRGSLRFAAPLELGAGAACGWLLLATGTAIAVPGASFLFTWPVLFATLGLSARILARDGERGALREAGVLAVSAALSLLLLVPMVQGIYAALALPESALVMSFLALVLGLLSPELAGILGRR